MAEDIVIVGVGGFGREVADVIEAMNATGESLWNILGFVDDAPSTANLSQLRHRDIAYLGTIHNLLEASRRPRYVVGIGDPTIRRRVATSLDAMGFSAATVIHPTSSMGSLVKIGPGSVVCAGVRLTTNIQIGSHVHLNLNSTVGHDTRIDSFVSVNPLASISGDCAVAEGVSIGVSASIINGVHIPPGTTIGGGACVVRDPEANSTVVGVPAKPIISRTP